MSKCQNNPRLLLLAAAMVLGISAPAIGQSCSGQYGAGQVCGNSGSSKGLPSAQALSPLVDRNFGSAQGSLLNRGVSTWGATTDPVLGIPGSVTGSLGFAGSTSGTVTVKAANNTGSWTFKLPTSAGSLNYVLVTDGSGNSSWVSNSSGGTVTSVDLSMPNIFTVSGNPVTSAGTLTATFTTQAKNIVLSGPSSGSDAAPTFRALVGADLPAPTASTLGGTESKTCSSSNWLSTISTAGVPSCTQPAFTDISGSVAAAQLPNPSASTLGGIESLAAVSSKWINTISTSGVPSATQPAFSDIAGNAAISQLPLIGNNSVLGNNSGGTAVPSALSATQVLDFIGTVQGDVLYRNGTVWTVLTPGTNGQVLTTGGASANPSWTTVTGTGTVTEVDTGTGLTGGPITTTGTIALASIADKRILANTSGGSAAPVATTATLVLDIIGATEGDVLYRGASAWLALAPGTNGQVLQTQGAGATPQWANAGTVSSISAGAGLAGGTITTSGSLTLDLAHANTWTAVQTFTNSDIRLLGSSTGYSTFTSANAGASNYTITFPAATVTLANLTTADQVLAGGATVTAASLGTVSSGTTTIDCGTSPLQYLTNGGAFTLAAPSNDSSCMIQVTNNGSAGAITFSGFTVGSSTGAALTTTNTNKFMITIARINGSSIYNIVAQQ